jgi:nucleoside-diphosphate kinase
VGATHTAHLRLFLQPDGVQRGLVGDIIKRFEQRGYTLKGLKLMNVERALAEKHYADLSSKPFFAGLVDYICSGPVVAMVSRQGWWICVCSLGGG